MAITTEQQTQIDNDLALVTNAASDLAAMYGAGQTIINALNAANSNIAAGNIVDLSPLIAQLSTMGFTLNGLSDSLTSAAADITNVVTAAPTS